MGTRKDRERQEELWVAFAGISVGPGHPFYVGLDEVLDGEGFDAFVEKLCAKFYAEKLGRPGLTPGIYFRSLITPGSQLAICVGEAADRAVDHGARCECG